MAKKRKPGTKAKTSSVSVRRRRTSSRVRRNAGTRAVGRFVVPAIISCMLLAGLIFIGLTGYETATASNFFGLRHVEIRGTERTSVEDIRRLVIAAAEKPGVWNADLAEIRTRVEKFPFVKTAAVSRILPAGIRVNVTERAPAAVVQLSSGNFLVDSEAVILSAAPANGTDFPFILKGWDETKTEKAANENLARLKIFKKMLEEWRQFDLSKRVKEVNLADLKEPMAVVEDSGRPISISLARNDLGKSLKTAIEAVSGKGAKIRSVNAAGLYPVIQFEE